jgi:hypothetical protein
MRATLLERPDVKLEDLEQFPDARDRERWTIVEAWAREGRPVREAIRISEHGAMPVSGGAVETGQVVLQNVPVQPYEINPARFFVATERNFVNVASFAAANDTPWTPVQLPSVGVYAKLVVQFVGSIDVGVAAATSTAKWPYGLLESIAFTANGQDDLFSCSGLALKVLERPRYPYLNSFSQDLAGAAVPVAGAGQNLAVGNIPLRLTWEIPLAFDESSLVGSVFAQAKALSLLLRGKTANVNQIATIGGGGTVVLNANSTWNVALQFFQIPVDQTGKIVLPDLRYLHGYNELLTPFASLGDVRTGMIRVAGTLQRIFAQNVQQNVAPPAFYNPSAAADVTQYRVEFGANKIPYRFVPAQFLTDENAKDYGAVLPYAFVCLDLARYNAVRDAVNLAGVTELFWVTTLGAGAAAPSASAQQRVVQETLFQ